MNLRHIWGDMDGTDSVEDTPTQDEPNYGKPRFPHKVREGGSGCGDMFMNYMDYVDDESMFMFTHGQVERMHACLLGDRASLGTARVSSTARSSAMGEDTTVIDQEIMQLERANRWLEASNALQKRLGLTSDPAEEARTLEHLVSVYRVKLQNEALAIRATELYVELVPNNHSAVDSLRRFYTATGDTTKLRHLEELAARRQDTSRGFLSHAGSSISSAMGTAGVAISTAAGGVFTAITTAPVAYEQPTNIQPIPSALPTNTRCPSCGAGRSPGVRTCASCGDAW